MNVASEPRHPAVASVVGAWPFPVGEAGHDALFEHGWEIPNLGDFTQAVQFAEIGLEMEAL